MERWALFLEGRGYRYKSISGLTTNFTSQFHRYRGGGQGKGRQGERRKVEGERREGENQKNMQRLEKI